MNPKAFLYWLVVALPLSWGLYKAIEKSVPLFSDKATTAPVAAPAAALPTPVIAVTPPPMPAASPTATP